MTEPKNSPIFGDSRDEVLSQAKAVGMKTKVEPLSDGKLRLEVEMPLINGGTTTLAVGQRRAAAMLLAEFTELVLFDDLDAVYNRQSGVIEAKVRQTSGFSRIALYELPGAEVFPNFPAAVEGDVQLEEDAVPEWASSRRAVPERWRLPIIDPDNIIEAELSPETDAAGTFGRYLRNLSSGSVRMPRRQISLKVSGLSESQTQAAGDKFRTLAASILFELDLTHGLSLALAPSPRQQALRGPETRYRSSSKIPSIPTLAYSPEALALYSYARSARGMPLLEFLAYYQSIEHYFPVFTYRATITRLRNSLRDPRFDFESDSDLSRIIGLVDPKQAGLRDEEDQLRATLSACITPADLTDFLSSYPDIKTALEDRNWIAKAPYLQPSNQNLDLIGQLAKRLYDIRCRIVHAKRDGGPRAGQVMLPLSPDSRRLDADIFVIQWVAQKIILAAAPKR